MINEMEIQSKPRNRFALAFTIILMLGSLANSVTELKASPDPIFCEHPGFPCAYNFECASLTANASDCVCGCDGYDGPAYCITNPERAGGL
jgi:hypothetical protein